ncbi:MAG: hypothetical protein JSW61_07270 [Candidatus Thorarchaeota archaeon]|nr:MAG: hypothetical protein JSW61_07270 [Candidatus Thorarchaeota archaeon]
MKESVGRFLAVLSLTIILTMTAVCQAPALVKGVDIQRAAVEYSTSSIVWSDNFDDEDISDWNIIGINETADPFYLIPGNISASGGAMRIIGPEWHYAYHNSSVAFGTWRYDVDIQRPDTIDRFAVGFAGEFNQETLLMGRGNNYLISHRIFDDGPSGDLRLAVNSVDGTTRFLDTHPISDIRGWWNIIVTREPSGQFYVYLNGVLIMDAVDLTHTTLDSFSFYGMANPAIDNVSVSNTIDYDAAPPKWAHPLHGRTIVLGDSFYYDLNATDHSGIDQWWIDDVENFTIDDDGVITNTGELVVGEYDVTVWVNDTLGNTQTGTFTLTVEESPAIIPIELIAIAIGIPGVVVVVLVLWRTRKK